MNTSKIIDLIYYIYIYIYTTLRLTRTCLDKKNLFLSYPILFYPILFYPILSYSILSYSILIYLGHT